MSATDFELYTEIEWTGVKIKECPFCGSAGQLYQYKAGPNVYQKVVMCANGGGDDENGECPMYMPPDGFYCATKKEAIQRWNKRANSDEHGEERDQLRARVAELEDYIQRTPEAIECRYNGPCDYKDPVALNKIKADAVREAASEIADKVASLEHVSAQAIWRTFQDWLEQKANQIEGGE